MKHKIDTDKIDKKAFQNARNRNVAGPDDLDNDLLVKLFEDLLPDDFDYMPGMSKENGIKTMLILILAKLGVTPEDYRVLYDLYKQIYPQTDENRLIKRSPSDDLINSKSSAVAGKTLVLKVQLKGIVKPPMWREVEVPANCTFSTLHEIIQVLVGLEREHLWQFNEKSFFTDVCIAERYIDRFVDMSDSITDEASETPLTMYLAEKGDTLEYVYDFGDDWIFTVKVLKVLDRKCEKPVCTKYKSEFNAYENLGGPYVYDELRAFADPDSEMTDEERKQVENEYGSFFDSKKSFKIWIESNKFDIEKVNEILAGIY